MSWVRIMPGLVDDLGRVHYSVAASEAVREGAKPIKRPKMVREWIALREARDRKRRESRPIVARAAPKEPPTFPMRLSVWRPEPRQPLPIPAQVAPDLDARVWCGQCERSVIAAEGIVCGSPFCGVRRDSDTRPQDGDAKQGSTRE